MIQEQNIQKLLSPIPSRWEKRALWRKKNQFWLKYYDLFLLKYLIIKRKIKHYINL